MKDSERLAIAIGLLINGWYEERRQGENWKHEPLLAQLGFEALVQRTGEPNLGSNPNKAGSRPPGNAAPLNLLHNIKEQAHQLLCEGIRLQGMEAVDAWRHRKVVAVLKNLHAEVLELEHVHPMFVCKVANKADTWVKDARLMLGYEVRHTMLADTVCGCCGGALSVPRDASGDVVCVGLPDSNPENAQEPCGMKYSRWDWPDLLEG